MQATRGGKEDGKDDGGAFRRMIEEFEFVKVGLGLC